MIETSIEVWQKEWAFPTLSLMLEVNFLAGKKIVEAVSDMLSGFLEKSDLELYDIELVKEGRDRILRVFIDKTVTYDGDGVEIECFVSTDECELVSRFLSERLDEEDPIEENYLLEVSSPGMSRQLKKEKDFIRYIGKLVDIKLYKSYEGSKEYTGILKNYENGNVTIETEEKKIHFEKEQIAKVSLSFVF
ncbi:ribosome maturation factor RimP [Peptostreptococcaceae bacterium pGA-8]|nr:ribosome maturation factor RimP [Peptostreptococcaceae bacterium pGA-8]